MQKLLDIIVPKVSIDESLFAKAPTETLRAFVKQLQTRLARLEIIVVSSVLFPYIPIDAIVGGV